MWHVSSSYRAYCKASLDGRWSCSKPHAPVCAQGHRVVLKVVRPELASERQRATLVREALLMRELQHPAIARVYGRPEQSRHHMAAGLVGVLASSAIRT